MNLKKIDENLAKGLNDLAITEANDLQLNLFSQLKAGQHYVVASPEGSGKTTLMLMHILQRLKKPVGENPRALIIAPTKADVIFLEEQFKLIGYYNKLRVYSVHDNSDIDYDKNHISLGIDVLIGTPHIINQLFGSAGFNGNTLQMMSFFKTNEMTGPRQEVIFHRLSDSITKAQRIIWCENLTEKIENLAFRIIDEPEFYEF